MSGSKDSFEKLKAMMHIVCNMAEDPSVLGRVKLNKVPWYADSMAFLLHGKSITGERYIKRQFGPVPARFMPAQRELEKEDKIVRGKVDYFNRTKEEFISMKEPDRSLFSADDMNIINMAFEHVCLKNTASSVSAETHNDIWELAEIGEEIPLETIFAAQLGEITEIDVQWANDKVSENNSRLV